MTQKPTVIGGPKPRAAVLVAEAPAPTSASVFAAAQVAQGMELVQSLPTTYKIIVSQDLAPRLEQDLAKLNFAQMPAVDMIKIGNEAERGLSSTLDKFVARVDRNKIVKLFELFDRVKKGVDDAKLDQVWKEIQAREPGKLEKAGRKFRDAFKSKESLQKAARQAYQEAVDLLTGRSKELSALLQTIEKEIMTELQHLYMELGNTAQLRQEYRGHLGSYAVATAVAERFLHSATEYVEQQRQLVANTTDAAERSAFLDLESKLQVLKSRALTLEGRYTQIPGDDEMIRQLEQAGVQTFLETMNTAFEQMIKIKLTVLALNSALTTQGVQQLTARNEKMAEQLDKIRADVTKQVVTTAANAPGENRVKQAAQIDKVIAEAVELNRIVSEARVNNDRKFAEVRTKFEGQRAQIAQFATA